MHTVQDEQTTIALVLQGRRDAFAMLVARYQDYVFSLVLRYVPQREIAEELAQDVFVKAYKNLAAFRGESKFSTWLYTIANTTCLSFLRKKELEIAGTFEDLPEHHADMLRSDHKLEHKSQHRMMQEAIQLLSTEDARIVQLFYQGEQSLDEIGAILGIPPNTIKVKLHRARQKLKEILLKHFPLEVKELYKNQ